jgi:hypothetical protein
MKITGGRPELFAETPADAIHGGLVMKISIIVLVEVSFTVIAALNSHALPPSLSGHNKVGEAKASEYTEPFQTDGMKSLPSRRGYEGHASLLSYNEEAISGDKKENRDPSGDKRAEEQDSPSRMSFSVECGWNGYTGIGPRFEYLLTDSFAVNAGMGLCLWGYRFSAGMRYYIRDIHSGPALGLGIAYNTGEKRAEIDGAVRTGTGVEDDTLIMNLNPVTVLNITFIYGFTVSLNTKLYVETGYGIAFSENDYEYLRAKKTGGTPPMNADTDYKLDIMEPGGFILSLGVSFLF